MPQYRKIMSIFFFLCKRNACKQYTLKIFFAKTVPLAYIMPLANEISDGLENERYKELWLDFSYDDIRYIIVPDILARIDIIKTITGLPNSCFGDQNDIPMQKSVLMSKILVLTEIRKDW